MGLTRRGFLGLLASAVPAMALDPERALWVPGQKTIVDLGAGRNLTPIALGDWVETSFDLDAEQLNMFVPPDWVIKNIMASLERRLRFGADINRSYDEQFRGSLFGDKTAARTPTVKIMAPRATLLDAG